MAPTGGVATTVPVLTGVMVGMRASSQTGNGTL
jgi:hypothetical protein